MNFIELKNCEKIYEKDKSIIRAVDGINYSFSNNNLYLILGNSGSGKSTLLHCMATLDEFTSGDISIIEEKVINLNENKLADLRKKHIGFVFQSYYLNNSLTAFQNILIPLYLNKEMDSKSREEKVLKLLKLVGLENRKNHFPNELSGGEQQRIAIARALVNDPSIILADEPTGNLDENNEKIIMKILNDLAKNGKCVIVVSHNTSNAKYADKILKMEKGKLKEEMYE